MIFIIIWIAIFLLSVGFFIYKEYIKREPVETFLVYIMIFSISVLVFSTILLWNLSVKTADCDYENACRIWETFVIDDIRFDLSSHLGKASVIAYDKDGKVKKIFVDVIVRNQDKSALELIRCVNNSSFWKFKVNKRKLVLVMTPQDFAKEMKKQINK